MEGRGWGGGVCEQFRAEFSKRSVAQQAGDETWSRYSQYNKLDSNITSCQGKHTAVMTNFRVSLSYYGRLL